MRIVNESGVNLERTKGNEEPKSKYYIIPEGENTEIQYFCGIRDNSEDLNIKPLIEIVPIENDEDEEGQSHPKRKLNNFNKSLEDGKFTYNENFDKAIFVIDRDPQNLSEDQLDEFIKNCDENGYFVYLSNPTFEIFLLMHDDTILKLDKKEMFEKMDSKLKKIDSTYIMSFSGIYDHTVVMFVMSKVMEFTKEEQNRIAMYLVNSI